MCIFTALFYAGKSCVLHNFSTYFHFATAVTYHCVIVDSVETLYFLAVLYC